MRRSSGSHVFLLIFFRFLPLMHGVPLAPALYVFGDSLLDSGNNNLLPTLAKAHFPPYGRDFAKGSTGRFTNGRTVADFIAEFLGLPYSPPFLSRRNTTVTGLNYASGSCGILPETGSSLGKCLNLGEQISLFQLTIASDLKKHFDSSSKLSEYLSKSIFLFSVGSNDYLNIYSGNSIFNSSKKNTPQQIATFLSDKLSAHFETLYNLGARKIVMFEIGPIGCTPAVAKTHQKTGPCLEESNQLVSYFNNKLPTMLGNLTFSLPGSTFILARCNWLGNDAVMNPSKYGLEDTSNACCLTWQNGTSACIPWVAPCLNSNKNYFWDGYHPTEAVYSEIASGCIKGNTVCVPLNLQQLVQM
ncbi:GDSL esterase/lipase 7-like [Herrania umbratica]|uniref:GDSL esterase/lipase 7-like n=1 Tax=Herrania umbratica TaxID=108875 RepID=A0A6J1BEE6_9ROSI|nr:GDSL esterase/lipase 7-like [Herrania umbratica]